MQPGRGRLADTHQVHLLYRLYAILTVLVTRSRDDGGQTMSEYAILLAWVALVVLVAAKTFGSSIARGFSSNASQL